MAFRYDGLHLMVDARCTSKGKLNNPACVIEVVEKIVRAIDMTMILPPVTVKFPHATSELSRIVRSLEDEGLGDSQTASNIKHDLAERENESYGYSTMVMIAESHLSLHTFPESNFFTFDCYSCKSFDADAVLRILREVFGVTSEKVYQQQRTFDFLDSDEVGLRIPKTCQPLPN